MSEFDYDPEVDEPVPDLEPPQVVRYTGSSHRRTISAEAFKKLGSTAPGSAWTLANRWCLPMSEFDDAGLDYLLGCDGCFVLEDVE